MFKELRGSHKIWRRIEKMELESGRKTVEGLSARITALVSTLR